MTEPEPAAPTELSPGSNEPIAQPPMAWLTPGLSRLLLLLVAICGALALCFTGHLTGTQVLPILTTVVGAVLLGSGHKQGADAAGNGKGAK